MSPVDPKRAEEIFVEARRLDPAAREGFLDRSCGDNEALRSEVDSLLIYDERETAFLDEPAPGFMASSVGNESAAQPDPTPERIGPYRILKTLGEGGMGVVYLAQQTEPVRRRVALKVIRRGMDSDRVIARFEAERQALALMDHTGIARVFDAGATDDGRPYFVMEHINGLPITHYCDQSRASVNIRLELFMTVCDAVHHAHQKGLIHRDIKPTNVLVAEIDGKPAVKIIDFGIAKAMQQPLTERTLYTEEGQLVGTPEYMAPEQADSGGLNVDTRADIYSLGVLLYEMLVGTLPFDPKSLREAGFAEIQRIIREEDPPRPSTRLSRLSAEDTDVLSQNRRTEISGLQRELRGDLDWITMKALEKDRTRRYSAASEFAEDIRRHLRYEPVNAGPPSASYRLRKFVRRNRAVVGGTLAVALVLVAGVIVASVLGLRAVHEYHRAEAVNSFLQEVLVSSDPFVLGDHDGEDSMLSRLDFAADQVETILGDYPDAIVDVRTTLAQAYEGIGEPEKAEAQAYLAKQLGERLFGINCPLTIRAINRRALAMRQLSRNAEALDLFESIHRPAQKSIGPEHATTLSIANNLAMLLKDVGRIDEAEALYRDTLATRRRVAGDTDRTTLTSMSNLARLLLEKGELGEAEELIGEAVDGHVARFGEDHPLTLLTIDQHGAILRDLGRLDEAAAMHRRAYVGLRDALGEDHVDTLGARYFLTRVLVSQQRLDEAEREFRDLLDVCRASFGDESNYTMTVTAELADVLTRIGRFDECEKLLQPVITDIVEPRGLNSPLAIMLTGEMAKLRFAQKHYVEAAAIFERLINAAEEMFGQVDPRFARFEIYAGLAQGHLGDDAKATRLLEHGLTIMLDSELPGEPMIVDGLETIIALYESTGQKNDADSWRAKLVAVDQ